MSLLDLLRSPLVASLLWCTLQTLSFVLVIAVERVRQRRAAQVVRTPDGFGLNPLFRKVVLERRWWSWRYALSTLLVAAAIFFFCEVVLGSGSPETVAMLDLLLGALVFSRLAVIQRLLNSLWLYDRIARHPASAVGQVTYDGRTLAGASAFHMGGFTLLLLAAHAASPSPFLLGGVIACGAFTAIGIVLAIRAKPADAQAPAGTGP